MSRIVITGVGAVTPFGLGADTAFERWLAGEDAIVEGRCTCADFDPSPFMSKQEIRRADRFTQLAIAAAAGAVEQAGWGHEPPVPADRVGCVIATGVGGLGTIEHELETLDSRGTDRLSPLGPTRLIANAAAATLAMRHGLQGEAYSLVAACASGAQAIAAGARMMRSGEVEAMIVGASDALSTKLSPVMLDAMGATSPTGTSRPFDRRRDGMIPSEGAAVLVLENEEVARARGAEILGELLGYGASSDAHKLASPHPEGRGAVQAMRKALEDADIEPREVHYVNAHGTSTQLNDRIESLAIKQVLGAHAREIPISTVKSAVGHLAGASGSIEAAVTLLALRRRLAPPTIGFEQPDEGLGDLDYVPDRPRALPDAAEAERLIGLSNSFGLGGHNGALVIASGPPPQ